MSHQTEIPGQTALFELSGEAPTEDRAMDSRHQKLDEMRASNAVKMATLTQQGMVINPQLILLTRMEALIEMMDAEQRLKFELFFESRMSELLDKADQERPRRSLLVPNGSDGRKGLVYP